MNYTLSVQEEKMSQRLIWLGLSLLNYKRNWLITYFFSNSLTQEIFVKVYG